MSAGDRDAFEGCFRAACGQAILEGWGGDDTATQAALDLLDFGNELLTAAGPPRLPGAMQSSPHTRPLPQPQIIPEMPIRQPTAFWQGTAGPGVATLLTLPPLSAVERDRPAARVKTLPNAEQPSRVGTKRKLSTDIGAAKKPRTAGKKTMAKGLPRVMQRHFALLFSCLDAEAPIDAFETCQVPSSTHFSWKNVECLDTSGLRLQPHCV